MWRSAVVRAAPLIARRYHASAITRKATAVSATAVVKTENRQKYQPLFEDPFAKEKLQRSTIYAISDNRTYGTMRFYGYHAMEVRYINFKNHSLSHNLLGF
jgi:hypothetical protein